jgi:hypothetical protein
VLLNNWVDVSYDDKLSITFKFETKKDAQEFMRLVEISRDVDDELLLYGDGVLRTVKRNGKRKTKRH